MTFAFLGGVPPEFVFSGLDAIASLRGRFRPHSLQCIYRTLFNGWPTQHRLHSANPRKCVCLATCTGQDAFSHYWNCTHLNSALLLGRCSYDVDPFRWLAVAYSVYCESSRRHREGLPPNLPEAVAAARKLHT